MMHEHLAQTMERLSEVGVPVSIHDVETEFPWLDTMTDVPGLFVQVHVQDGDDVTVVPFFQPPLGDEGMIEFGDLNLTLDVTVATPVILAFWIMRIGQHASVLAIPELAKLN